MAGLEVPDQGWAWVIAFAACIINTLLSGLSRMIGILYVAVLEVYGVSRQEATLPFAVRNSIRMLSGPLVGIVGQSYGIRTVTFGGGLVAAAGAALCCVAPNIMWLTILWGGVHGMGFAFANTLFQVVVNQYFEKYRVTASGIALSGACVGSLVFPIMIEKILDVYGLAGVFLMLGGVVLHVLPPALILKSPPWVENPAKYARQLALQEARERVESQSKDSRDVQKSKIILELVEEERNNSAKFARQRSLSNPAEELVYNFNINQVDDKKGIRWNQKRIESWKTQNDHKVVCTLYKVKDSPNTRTKWTHQIENIPEETNGKIQTISEKVSRENGVVSSPEEKDQSRQSILQSIKSIGVLYKNPVYVLINVCISTYIIIFIPILTVIVDYTMDKGISEEDGKYLINAMAMGDLVGRIGFGWVTDRELMTIPYFMLLMLVLQGVFISLFPIATSFYTFMVVVVLYGITSGSMLVLFPVLILKYVDLNAQSVAMSCDGFMSGIVSFCIPPLIGYFRDNVGSYDGMFYLLGGVSIISGGLWLLEPVVVKCYYGQNSELHLSNKTYVLEDSASANNESRPK